MGLGDFLKDVGDGFKSAGSAVGHALSPDNLNKFSGEDWLAQHVFDPVKNHAVMPTVEHVSKALNWTYDNGISQPISTAMMAGELPGGPFSAHNWAAAWHAANHISPAQALFLSPEQTKEAVDSPLRYYKPPDAYLPPGFNQLSDEDQQAELKKAGMPAVGNAYIEELRQSSAFFKNASGVGDLALRWFGDPVVIATANIGKLRKAKQVMARPTPGLGVVARPGKRVPVGIGRTEGGWSSSDIDKIMSNSRMSQAIDFIWTNRADPQLLNNLAMARNSAMGPRFGAIATLLKSPDEVHDFIRVGLGDVDAIERLQMKNALAGSRIEQETSRVARLGLMASHFTATGSPQLALRARQAMARGQAAINADEQLVRRYNQIVGAVDETGKLVSPGVAHQLDQVNLSKWSFARAQARTAGQGAYRAGSARGAQAGALGRQVTVQPTPLFSRGVSTPVDLGFHKSRLFGVGDFFSSPITLVRAFGNARPNGYMRLDDIDKDSIAELRGQIARIPGISDKARLNMLNEYLTAETEGERLALVRQIGATGAAKVAEKHGLDPKAGLEIYQEHLKRQFGEIDNMKRYSAASRPVRLPDGTMARVNVDEFMDNGGKLVVHPNLVTRLVNDHVFQDLDEMDRVLARHASAIRVIRESTLGNTDWMTTLADNLSAMWKFGTLFRLGYIPRVAGDDLAGQVARLGAASMALRAGWGVRNAATNVALWHRPAFYAAAHETAMEGVRYADDEIAKLAPRATRLKQKIDSETHARATDVTRAQARVARAQARVNALTPAHPPAQHTAAHNYLAAKQNELTRAQARQAAPVFPTHQRALARLQGQLDHLSQGRAQAQADADTAAKGFQPVRQGNQPVQLPGGAVAPAAFAGKGGDYYYKEITSDEALGQLFLTNKSLIHGHLMRSFDNGAKAISPAQDEALHAVSWAHAINAQLMQDPLAAQAVRGASVRDMTKWLTSTAEGRRYQRRMGMDPSKPVADRESVIRDPADLANAAWHDVAEYLPTPEIRLKALEPDGVTPAFLKSALPMAARPDVHTGQVGGAARSYYGVMDRVMAKWYKVAATIPADRLSRHPLFNQLYTGHLKTLAGQLQKQGAYDTTVHGVELMAQTARSLALRDTRRLVFDIAHRSDVGAALRFISPFFSATAESFQRWGRILADRPQVVGYANDFYNAPVAAGAMQDADGNTIDRNGYSYTIDPKTGKAVKRLVPKNERYIVGRMPKWVTKTPLGVALGVEPSSGNFKLSQNSMDIVTQGDPWFNPGVGPIVQIPVNEFVKDKPKAAEVARHLGVLPFGPQNGGPFGSGGVGAAAGFLLPSTIKNFMTSFDTSDQRYQAVKMQIMQRAIFEHDQLGKPMPTAKQIASQTRNYWLFSAASAFMQPMATSKQDKYQFFRDQYNALRRINPLTADDEFLKRYGESYFVFAQSQSKNESGIPATTKAVELEKRYGDLIAQHPELGALIVGPEGDGPFSPEAYSYQLNTPVTPGGAEMQRTKMSADEALAENQRRLGWSKYTAMMNGLTATLHDRGLKSFSDKGAEDLKATKAAMTAVWSQPLLPNGQPNPTYNEAWSKDFSTYDTLKYDRLVPGLMQVATSDLAQDPNRSDLRSLKTYLLGRMAVNQLLAQRAAGGGAKSLVAQSNSDLANAWQAFVDGLIEKDTRFGDLHSRYLARDMNYDDSQAEAA